jgi:phage gpG-like protein
MASNGVKISIDIEGETQLSRRLLIVADGITNFETPLKNIGNELLKTFDMNFAEEGRLFGGWKERKQDYPWPILQKSGRMRQSFRSSVGQTQVSLKNTAPYFKYHQSNRPRRRLPRRVMMKVDQDRKTFIIKTLQSYIVGLIRSK